MAFEFKLPDIGEGVHEGEIVQWLVKPGDFVKEDQAIVEVMTDKVTAEIPAPVSGVIQELRGQPGQVVTVGSVIAVFGDSSDKSAQSESSRPEQSPQAVVQGGPSPTQTSQANPNQNGYGRNGQVQTVPSTTTVLMDRPAGPVLAAPATRKLARDLGVTLSQVVGTGPKGRITPTDVKNYQAQPTVPLNQPLSAAPAESAGERRVPFAGLRRKIAEHLVKSKQTAPHFAYVEEVDMSKLVAMREELMPIAAERNVKLSYLPFVIQAVIEGLKKYPVLNAQLDESRQELVYKHDYNMGVAVATQQGLIVPVIHHADQKSLLQLATEIQTLAETARSGKLMLNQLQGGTFTLTSIGSIGGLFGIPIINYPEVAIMGVNKIEKRPVVRTIQGQDQIVIRDMMHLSISCDHRVVDGAEAALFVKEVIRHLENPLPLIAKL